MVAVLLGITQMDGIMRINYDLLPSGSVEHETMGEYWA
jgi:hypothetical protein